MVLEPVPIPSWVSNSLDWYKGREEISKQEKQFNFSSLMLGQLLLTSASMAKTMLI